MIKLVQTVMQNERACTMLSICIVNYKTPQLVISCISSLLSELTTDTFVTIVDNGSRDDSVALIGAWLENNDVDRKCKIIELMENNGFSAGYNAAIRALPAKYYLLLNSDTLILPSAISRLLDATERYPKAGLFGPRLEWPDGTGQESCFQDHTPLSELVFAAGTRHITTLLRRYSVPMPVTNLECLASWISFAAVLIRDATLKSSGMLDENFFLYFEDSEYCLRARNAGWKIVYIPTARIIHLHGQSSQVEAMINTAKRLPHYYYASRTRYFRIRFGLWGPTLANFGWCIGRLISKTRETIGSKQPHLPEMAWLDIWTNWVTPLRGDRRRA